MPIKIPGNLPAAEILNNENIFIMDEKRALEQDIRPLKIAILNLMPTKIVTETQLLRLLSNSPLQIDITFLTTATYESKNTPKEHLQEFYVTFNDIKHQKFDGLIITGAPVEYFDFSDVYYWEELCEVMDWVKTHVFSTLYVCWGALAGLFYNRGINKYPLEKKISGIFEHKTLAVDHPLLRGFDDTFYAPHSRYSYVLTEDIIKDKGLQLLAVSDDAGMYIAASADYREIYITGHPEYDQETLKNEYERDLTKNISLNIPKNYFPGNDPKNPPCCLWRAHANLLYSNWLNYCVYQNTPYNINQIGRRYICDLDEREFEVLNFDVVVVGTGIAGLYAALNLDPSLNCAVITKSNMDESNSYLAQGGIAAVITKEDTYISHIDDTMRAGAGLSDLEAVKVLVEEGPSDIKRLIDLQIPFDVNPEGDLQITKEGGHRAKRVVHCGGDATGKETTLQLGRIALRRENLSFFFDTYLVDVLTEKGKAYGVLINTGENSYKIIHSNHIIIASGGIGQIYRYTTNPLGAVGDGIAACFRAGAKITDMEFIQFHPTTLISRECSQRLFLISEAVRGEGGILKNSSGEAFMQGKHEMADLAPRDIVTREILRELQRTGDANVFLDVSSMSTEFFANRFPTIYNECVRRSIKLTAEAIPIRPAQHYLMGGVVTDHDGRTNIDGLFCCGECARTGIHGANRLASNSLLECLVFGRRSAEYINKNFTPIKNKTNSSFLETNKNSLKKDHDFFAKIEAEIKSNMSRYAGPMRKKSDLLKLKSYIDSVYDNLRNIKFNNLYEYKIYNMLTIAQLIVDGALSRNESAGAHHILNE